MAEVSDSLHGQRCKFRLGDSQSITVRCEPWHGEYHCVARARLGKINWSAAGQASVTDVENFIAAVEGIVATLSGSADLKTRGVGSFEIHVSVEHLGAVKTDYIASGSGAGKLGTGWRAVGTFIGWHQHFLAIAPPG